MASDSETQKGKKKTHYNSTLKRTMNQINYSTVNTCKKRYMEKVYTV